jgi:hypothetical protein
VISFYEIAANGGAPFRCEDAPHCGGFAYVFEDFLRLQIEAGAVILIPSGHCARPDGKLLFVNLLF